MLKIRTPAKINLFLKVLRKRNDGYHDIFSWFQSIDLFDYLTFEKKDKRGPTLYLEGGYDIPIDSRNLVVKTAEMLFEKYSIPGGMDIGLKKNIPIAAGLGGGSSDSAATIYAMNELYDLKLSHRDMQKVGLELGSDIPFFFSSGQTEITGRGEIIKDIKLPIDYTIILAVPNIAVSTADSYRRLNLGLTSLDVDVKFPICSDFTGLVAQIGDVANDFERVHCESYPVLGEIREALLKAGAAIVRMSGSGPAMFGLFEKMPDNGSFSQIARGNWRIFRVRPITLPAWE